MCGIAGFWSPENHLDPRAVAERMAQRLEHRGPDDSGVWLESATQLVLAHRRLSVLDLSPAGHQPMESPCGRYVVVFNGEIYNHNRIRRVLEDRSTPPEWTGHSDTETLLAAVSRWGVEDTLKQLDGMFAIAIWDRREPALYLARDRLGEKPLYYGWQDRSFLFASELKAFNAHPAFSASVSREALSLFLKYNYVPAPHSIYEGILKLPPGSFLKLDSTGAASGVYPTPTNYWSLAIVAERGIGQPFRGSETEALDTLEEKLTAAVDSQMLSDVPLGFLLSGGIDSSLICALGQKACSQSIRTFSVGFEDGAYDESEYAREIADQLGSVHTELVVNPADALAVVDKLPEIYDEPFADSSQLPTYLVMNLVKQHVTVALSGDGGDELFGGYNRYLHAPALWRRFSRLPVPTRALATASLTSLPAGFLNRFSNFMNIAQLGDKAHKLGEKLRGVASIDDLYLALVSEWSDAGGLVRHNEAASVLLDRRADWPRIDNPEQRMMALDSLTYLPDDILVKVDRAAMAISLETRAPFLDRHVVEFAWQLPLEMKLRKGKNKYLLRQLLNRHLPQKLFDRPKMGFSIPLDQWLRGPLRSWAEELLSERNLESSGYLKARPIRQAWSRHLSGKNNFGYRLWSVLMFQVWLEQQ